MCQAFWVLNGYEIFSTTSCIIFWWNWNIQHNTRQVWYMEGEGIDTLNRDCVQCIPCASGSSYWEMGLCADASRRISLCFDNTLLQKLWGFLVLSLHFHLQLVLSWATSKQQKGGGLFIRVFPCPLPQICAALWCKPDPILSASVTETVVYRWRLIPFKNWISKDVVI